MGYFGQVLNNNDLHGNFFIDCKILSTSVQQTSVGRSFDVEISVKKPQTGFISEVTMVSCKCADGSCHVYGALSNDHVGEVAVVKMHSWE